MRSSLGLGVALAAMATLASPMPEQAYRRRSELDIYDINKDVQRTRVSLDNHDNFSPRSRERRKEAQVKAAKRAANAEKKRKAKKIRKHARNAK